MEIILKSIAEAYNCAVDRANEACSMWLGSKKGSSGYEEAKRDERYYWETARGVAYAIGFIQANARKAGWDIDIKDGRCVVKEPAKTPRVTFSGRIILVDGRELCQGDCSAIRNRVDRLDMLDCIEGMVDRDVMDIESALDACGTALDDYYGRTDEEFFEASHDAFMNIGELQ